MLDQYSERLLLGNMYVNRNTPTYLVVHYDESGTSASELADFYQDLDLGASTHYVVDDTEVIKLVDPSNAALHVTDGYEASRWLTPATSYNTIGVTMCGSADSSDNLYDLCKDLLAEYQLPPDNILRHYDVSGKNSPSNWRSDQWSAWWKFKERFGSTKVAVSATGYNITPATMEEGTTELPADIKLVTREVGIFTPLQRLPLYVSPTGNPADIIDYFEAGEAVAFDSFHTSTTTLWIHYESYTGSSRYLPIREYKAALAGTLTPSTLSNNIDTYTDYDNGKDKEEDVSGVFISTTYTRIRTSPTTSGIHIGTLTPNQGMTFNKIVYANDYQWAVGINGDLQPIYVATAVYDHITGDLSYPYGDLIYS